MHAAACNEERRCYAIREKLLSGSLEERTQQAAVGWRRLEKQANKEKSILELLFGEGKVAAAVAHLGGVKEIRDRERELPWCSRWTRKSDEIESRVHVSGRLCACVLGVRRVRVNVVLCVYVSVQGVRERRECDRQRENIREGRVRLDCWIAHAGGKRMEGAAVCLLQWREEQRRVQQGAWHGREKKNKCCCWRLSRG